MIHTVKGFGIVNKAEIDVFLELSCVFHDPADVGNLISGSSVVLEKTLESPLDCKEIQPVHSEGHQPCDFFGRNDAKAETPILWLPDAESRLTGKDPAESTTGKPSPTPATAICEP